MLSTGENLNLGKQNSGERSLSKAYLTRNSKPLLLDNQLKLQTFPGPDGGGFP